MMYDEYYHMRGHPLHAELGHESIPDLKSPLKTEPIKDISQWNNISEQPYWTPDMGL